MADEWSQRTVSRRATNLEQMWIPMNDLKWKINKYVQDHIIAARNEVKLASIQVEDGLNMNQI